MSHTSGYQEALRRLAIAPEAGPGRRAAVEMADALGCDIEAGLVDRNDQ